MMKKFLKVGDIIVNLNQVTTTRWHEEKLYFFFTNEKRYVVFEGEEADAVWAELERRSNDVLAELPGEDVDAVVGELVDISDDFQAEPPEVGTAPLVNDESEA
jgi:hypothetical protein